MAIEDPGKRLETLAARARERSARLATELESRQGQPPAPGDLFVLAATKDLPVEWAILDRRSSGELLAVPADTNPLAGSADVEVDDESPGGPLVLRCRFGVWLAADIFDPELRTGFLAPETVADALHCWRRGKEGGGEASPLAEEVDADPEYVDWIQDVPQRARDLAAAARPVRRKESPPVRSWAAASIVYKLAATLALACIGLSVWVVLLQQRVDRLEEPILNPHAEEVDLEGNVRGDGDIRVPPEARHIQLLLIIGDTAPGEGRLEIVALDEDVVWQSGPVDIQSGDLSLVFRREKLPDGEYEIRLYQGSSFDGTPVVKKTVRIETVK